MTDMLLKMSEMSRFCPARASYICCLYFSRVSHYNLTTFESNTIESIGHWCDLSKLGEHCRNLKNLALIYQPYPWHFATSTHVKCLVKSTALALNGSYTDKELPMNCGIYCSCCWCILMMIRRGVGKKLIVCMQACEVCDHARFATKGRSICFGTWYARVFVKFYYFH